MPNPQVRSALQRMTEKKATEAFTVGAGRWGSWGGRSHSLPMPHPFLSGLLQPHGPSIPPEVPGSLGGGSGQPCSLGSSPKTLGS